MNFGRLALAAVVTWVVYMAIGFVVNTVLLADIYALHSSVMRPEADMNSMLPLGFGASFIGFFLFSYAYAKGYEGGSGLQEGLRFGVLVALMLICFSVVWEYVVFRLSGTLAAYWIVDYLVEFAIYGMVVGTIYRPATIGAARRAAV